MKIRFSTFAVIMTVGIVYIIMRTVAPEIIQKFEVGVIFPAIDTVLSKAKSVPHWCWWATGLACSLIWIMSMSLVAGRPTPKPRE